MRKLLLINSLSGAALLIFGSALVLVTVPLFIQKLGIEKYAIFSLIIIVNNFSFFFGLGINFGLIKFLSEQGKTKESEIDILTALTFLCLTILPFTLLALYFNDFILTKLLYLPTELVTEDTIWLFNFLIIANFFQFIGQIPVSVLDSIQKIYLTNLYQGFNQIIYWCLTLTSIFIFGTLKMIGLGILLSTVIWFIVISKSFVKHWGRPQFSLFKMNHFRKSLKKQASYTVKIYSANLINFFYEPFTKILISSLLGVTEVGLFDIILRVRTQIWNLLSKLLYPLYPFLSGLKDRSAIRNLVHDTSQKLTYLILLFIAVSIYIIPDFIFIWLDSNQEVISNGLIIVLSGNLIGIIAIPIYQFLNVKGYPGKTVIAQVLNVIVNLLIFLLLYRTLGFTAAILGNIGAILSSFVLCIYYQKKYLDSLIFDNVSQFLKFIIFFLLLLSSGYLFDNLMDNLSEVLLLPVILSSLAIIFIRFLKLITPEDILRYSGKNEKVYNFLVKVFVVPAGSLR